MPPYPSKARKLDYMKGKGYSDHLRSQHIVCIMLNDKQMQLLIRGQKWPKTPTFLIFSKAPDDFGVHLCPTHVQKCQSSASGPGRLGERHRQRPFSLSARPWRQGPSRDAIGGRNLHFEIGPKGSDSAPDLGSSRTAPPDAPRRGSGKKCRAVIYVTDKKWISCHIHRRQMKPRTSQRIRKTRRPLPTPTGWDTFR